MVNQLRVITTDFKLVKLHPVANEADDLALCCAGISEDGVLYVWGNLSDCMKIPSQILNQTSDLLVSDEDLIRIN